MSLNTSLYTVTASLILDSDGGRLYANYYTGHDETHPFRSQAQQLKFEKALFPKIYKMHQDVILFDNHLITYKQTNDVVLVLVAPIDENELMVYLLTSNLNEALLILLDNALDKLTVLDKYDLVALAVDETIDDGAVLEIDPAIIVSRVTKTTEKNASLSIEVNSNKIELNERSLFNAFSFASKKIGERLQQGL